MAEPGPDLRITVHAKQKKAQPELVLCSMRMVEPASRQVTVMPVAFDTQHVDNQIAAAIHRFGRKMPPRDEDTMKKFKEYAIKLMRKKFEPVVRFKTLEEWLSNTSYPEAKKKLIKMCNACCNVVTKETLEFKSFLKKEGYMKDTYARGIQGIKPDLMAFLGPIHNSIDEAIFCGKSKKYFVKKTPVEERPKLMRDVFGSARCMGTDFSSFEAHHTGVFSEFEAEFYAYMLSRAVVPNHVKRLLHRMMLGVNKQVFKHITTQTTQVLMSGALDTSSRNGVLNFMILSFLTADACDPGGEVDSWIENHDNYFRGFVEGDDGICLDRQVRQETIEKLGLSLKPTYGTFSELSFCGCVCDPDDLVVMTDPVKALVNFFTLPPEAKDWKEVKCKTLLRAKALSYKYQYGSCPIVGALADRVCYLTRSLKVDSTSENDYWKREMLQEALDKKVWRRKLEVPTGTRAKFALVYGIPVSRQLEIEEAIEKSVDEFAIYIDDLAPSACKYMAQNFLEPVVHNVYYPPFQYFKNPLIEEIKAKGLKPKRSKERKQAELRELPPFFFPP